MNEVKGLILSSVFVCKRGEHCLIWKEKENNNNEVWIVLGRKEKRNSARMRRMCELELALNGVPRVHTTLLLSSHTKSPWLPF